MTENKPIMIDKKEKIEKEIKEMIPKLANIEFTKDDELEFCKKVLKDTRQQLTRKTKECEKWKNVYEVKEAALEEAEEYTEELEEKYHKLQEQLDQLKAENEKLKKHNEALLKWNGKLTTTFEFNNQEIKQAEQKLERIRDFMLYEFSGKNEWVKKQILQIIDEVDDESF